VKAMVNVTVDTATLSRPPVERLLRQHHPQYDIAGTETVADESEVSGGQPPYQLRLAERETDEEKIFLERVLAVLADSSQRRAARFLYGRAARFLYAHRRERRAIFVTENAALLSKRERLSAVVGTKVLSFAEFERWCSEQPTK
jgi:hypothetical protein